MQVLLCGHYQHLSPIVLKQMRMKSNYYQIDSFVSTILSLFPLPWEAEKCLVIVFEKISKHALQKQLDTII